MNHHHHHKHNQSNCQDYPYVVDCEGNELISLQPPSSINSEIYEEEEQQQQFELENPFQSDLPSDIPYALTSNIEVPLPSDTDYSPFLMDDPLELDNLMFSIEGRDSTHTEPSLKRKKPSNYSFSTPSAPSTTTTIPKYTTNSPIFNRKPSKNP